ncbi:MAG: molybdopterin-guanine dinucleotide biosynthesis protein A [Candidatus Rokubacteria bacterium GWC2_70_16]|nr:MAG: molybdopterin-guanine dinucleotide biosynthesis protein A [Candidatus Rokubacteria bacterium GWC2_70_16]OGL18194.1 MAG: molybdopterin-guanine dinucleotide biosynthesis protein A [Candidatus Rokubacteria bacterium RIFCSPLOWO2_12_FULL_71_19]
MLNDVVKVEPRGEYRLWLQFQDGVEGEVDLGAALTFQGVFAPLRDPAYFARVRVNAELGTICWPNDADWDPLVLYSLVTKRPIESLLSAPPGAGR